MRTLKPPSQPAMDPADIQSLNIDELDIEELERRLEMASLLPLFSDCYVNTGAAESSGSLIEANGDGSTNCRTFCCPSNTVPVNRCEGYWTDC